jgi:hypothetical protein
VWASKRQPLQKIVAFALQSGFSALYEANMVSKFSKEEEGASSNVKAINFRLGCTWFEGARSVFQTKVVFSWSEEASFFGE